MTTVKLTGDYKAKGFDGTQIVLREPLWADYFAIGPVAEYQKDASGVNILLVHEDRIERYAERLANEASQPALPFLTLRDTLAVREAIKGFFSDAQTSLTSRPENSSGDADGGTVISPD